MHYSELDAYQRMRGAEDAPHISEENEEDDELFAPSAYADGATEKRQAQDENCA